MSTAMLRLVRCLWCVY